MLTFIIILIGLFFCHYLADYTWLSTKEMLDAKRLGTPFLPIWLHAVVHGLLMFFFMLIISTNFHLIASLTIFQIVTHFVIDVCKGRLQAWQPELIGNPANKLHWVVFGFDQFLHAIVIIIMGALLIL